MIHVSEKCSEPGCQWGGSMFVKYEATVPRAREKMATQFKEEHALGEHDHYNQVIDSEPDPSKRKF